MREVFNGCLYCFSRWFWGLSHKPEVLGFQVDQSAGDPNDNGSKVTSDYIIKINNLPDEWFKPEETKRTYTYTCKTCNRTVPEWERRDKSGCYANKNCVIEETPKDVEIWDSGVFSKYNVPKLKWLTPCYRIFLNNSKGLNKWVQIWSYAVKTISPTTRLIPDLIPVAMGTRITMDIGPEAIKEITLPKLNIAKETIVCDYPGCGEVIYKDEINRHKWGKHKIKSSK